MDFSIEGVSSELAPFQDEVRGWLEEQMREGLQYAWSAAWSTRDNEDEYQFRRRLGRQMGEKGWLFPTYPVEYGGGGLSADHQAVIDAALSLAWTGRAV